jgi:ankyrin repeat protein
MWSFSKKTPGQLGQELILEIRQYTPDIKEIEKLLKKGANVNAKNKYGYTAAMLAAANGHTDALKVIAEAGADLNLQDNVGNTAAMMAAICGKIKELEYLLNAKNDDGNYKVDRNLTNNEGETIVSILLKNKENIDFVLEIRPDLKKAWDEANEEKSIPIRVVIEQAKKPAPAPKTQSPT